MHNKRISRMVKSIYHVVLLVKKRNITNRKLRNISLPRVINVGSNTDVMARRENLRHTSEKIYGLQRGYAELEIKTIFHAGVADFIVLTFHQCSILFLTNSESGTTLLSDKLWCCLFRNITKTFVMKREHFSTYNYI